MMFRLVFIFIFGTMISSPVCHTMVVRPDVASDSSVKSESGATSQQKAAPQLLRAPRDVELYDPMPRPTAYFEFVPVDKPPEPGWIFKFWKWFTS